MKNIALTFCATSLFFTSVLLYYFCTGKIERPQPDYLQNLKKL